MTFSKIFTAILFTLVTFQVQAQKKQDYTPILVKDETTGLYSYDNVQEVAGAKKEDLFDRAKKWILANMKSGDNNIAFNDKDYTIVNTGSIKIDAKHTILWEIRDGYFDFKINIAFKDGKYKIHIDNVTTYVLISDGSVTTTETHTFEELKDKYYHGYAKKQVNEKLTAFIAAFNKAMTNPSGNSDNW